MTPLIRARQGALAGLFILGLIASGTALIPPWLTKLVIDRGLIAGDVGALVQWSVALFAVGLASLALGALASILHMRASVAMLAQLRSLLARTVLERSPPWRSRHQTGELLSRLDGDAGEVQQFAFNALLSGSGALVRLVGGGVMLFVLSWQLAIVACILAPAEAIFFAYARPRTQRLASETRAERGGLAAQLAEMIGGLLPIQAASGEDRIALRLARQQGSLNTALVRAQLWGEVTRAVPSLLTATMRAAVFLIGGIMVIRDGWPLGSLIAFLAYLGFLTGPMQTLIGLWHAQARTRAALDRLSEIMEPDAMTWLDNAAPVPRGPCSLRFEDVEIRVDGQPILAGINAEVPAGTKVHLTGDSGVGKSTFLALLQRHADPTTGRVLLGGADLRALARSELRRAVRLVPQRPYLLKATVTENLRLTNPAATESDIEEMLYRMGLAERLAPDTDLGEDGMTLSGGERQRLCLARALLAPFRVLIMDEALSEVDTDTAAGIVADIDRLHGETTRIIASHGGADILGPFDMALDLSRWKAVS